MMDKELREEYEKEPWGKLLSEMGKDPVRTESQARRVAEYAAERLEEVERELIRLREWFLMELAREYHEKTEAYDRTVCTGLVKDGEIHPASGEEWKLSNLHAIKLNNQLYAKAYKLGFTPQNWSEAIQRSGAGDLRRKLSS